MFRRPEYKVATARFLNLFNQRWDEILFELNCRQSQLIRGNKLRPQICLWGYLATVPPDEVGTQDLSHVVDAALCIEMVHKASLLLDDWIDADDERHGHPAFHITHTPQHTVLFALNLIGLSMYRLKNIFPSVVLPQNYSLCLDTMATTVYLMAKGALKELQLTGNDIFDNQKVREIVQMETAEILGNSMLLGYYIGCGESRNPQVEKIFKRQGDQCGYLFQALNDLEAFDNPQELKKHKGKLNLDLFMQRKNLVVSSLYAVANKKDKATLENATEEILIRLVKKYHVVEALKTELDSLYKEILSVGPTLQATGLATEWCEGLTQFLEQVKRFAEERLQKPVIVEKP